MSRPLTIRGTVVHAPTCGTLEILPDALVRVDSAGMIVDVLKPESPGYELTRDEARIRGELTELSPGQLLLPGFVDLHVHAPQWPQLGKALDRPLEEWLQSYTFPLEAKYADLDFARASYSSLVDALLAHGTTTAVYFGTIHLPATQLLADLCLAKGQRAFIGKVAMDNPAECPDFYRDESTEAGLRETRALVDYVRAMSGNQAGLIQPVVTPRFIPSCTDAMLDGLGLLAAELGCHIQTHCSESDWEHGYVLDRHAMSDSASLDRFRLLTDKTVLAHCNFISNDDMGLIKQRGAGVAHCPLSNFYFSNAVFPARRALDFGLKVGLGTDIAGGPSASLLNTCATAVTSSRALEEGVDPELPPASRGRPGARIDFKEAFHMATAGGGRALGIDVGLIKPGYRFDALVFDPDAGMDVVVWPELDGPEDVLQKAIYSGRRENITAVWVEGARVR